MTPSKGILALMGSGELTATMVEVHKRLLAGLSQPPRAVFLDTPAGFQLNADQLSEKAADYFLRHILQPLGVASFKVPAGMFPFPSEASLVSLPLALFFSLTGSFFPHKLFPSKSKFLSFFVFADRSGLRRSNRPGDPGRGLEHGPGDQQPGSGGRVGPGPFR